MTFWIAALLAPVGALAAEYPLSPDELCGATRTCQEVLDSWNDATWSDLVDESFDSSLQIAAVRWYRTEGECSCPTALSDCKCEDQLHDGDGSCPVLDIETHKFCGVTDELSNVLLSLAMGSNEAKYAKLHRFSELLRDEDTNGLQCWKWYVPGTGVYDEDEDLCVVDGSASDASLRILHAYALACAKQEKGLWTTQNVNYCADYVEQGNAILGFGTASHGEVKVLPAGSPGKYFFAAGYNQQPGAPSGNQCFHPDYLELQALMDFAEYTADPEVARIVSDALDHYVMSSGDNRVQCGKSGRFNVTASPSITWTWQCDEVCSPGPGLGPYLDNIDG